MQMKWSSLILLMSISACPLVGGCASASTITDDDLIPLSKIEKEYIIGQEDLLDIVVWGNEDLSTRVSVRPDGMISLPLLNDIQAAGLTVKQLQQSLARKLKPFMDAPDVAVMVIEVKSRKFFIQGEVQEPGAYPLNTDTTVVQAVSVAGGFTEFAKKNKFFIIRREKGKERRIEINYKAIVTGKDPGQNIYLRPGDTLIVP